MVPETCDKYWNRGAGSVFNGSEEDFIKAKEFAMATADENLITEAHVAMINQH